MAAKDAFEDRGQSQRPAKPQVGARNQGGFQNSPATNKQTKGKVAPPPVSRARKDSILRPVNDGGSSQGGVRSAEGSGIPGRRQPPGPPRPRGPQQEVQGTTAGIGIDRQQVATEDRAHAQGNIPAPPMPRNRKGQPGIGAEMAAEGLLAEPPGVAPTPGSVAPGDAQEALTTAEMPPSSPANAGARQPQGPAELGQAMSDSGNPIQTPDAQPPVNDPEVRGGMPAPEDSAASFNDAVGEAGPDGFGGRMGEELLGFKIEGSDQISNGKEWKGEIGPGMPSNQSGALGIPGQQNSPEDVAFNRGRFDSALEQNKGDKHKAAMSSGSFPSGNPIAHGTMTHMDRLVSSSDGDGVDTGQMDEGTRRRYKADAVRQTEEFGAYPGMDDPDSPAPPVRPLSWSYNAHTNKWVSPEGAESYIERFGGSE